MELNQNHKYALDTNILIYSLDRKSRYYQKSRHIISLVKTDYIQGFVTDKNFYEFYAVLSNLTKKKMLISESEFKNTIQIFRDIFKNKIITAKPETLNLTLDLMNNLDSSKSGKYIHDVVSAAICISHSIDSFITYNTKDFVGIPGLRVATLA